MNAVLYSFFLPISVSSSSARRLRDKVLQCVSVSQELSREVERFDAGPEESASECMAVTAGAAAAAIGTGASTVSARARARTRAGPSCGLDEDTSPGTGVGACELTGVGIGVGTMAGSGDIERITRRELPRTWEELPCKVDERIFLSWARSLNDESERDKATNTSATTI